MGWTKGGKVSLFFLGLCSTSPFPQGQKESQTYLDRKDRAVGLDYSTQWAGIRSNTKRKSWESLSWKEELSGDLVLMFLKVKEQNFSPKRPRLQQEPCSHYCIERGAADGSQGPSKSNKCSYKVSQRQWQKSLHQNKRRPCWAMSMEKARKGHCGESLDHEVIQKQRWVRKLPR